MEVECIGNTQIIHMEETGMTQRTIGLRLKHTVCSGLAIFVDLYGPSVLSHAGQLLSLVIDE